MGDKYPADYSAQQTPERWHKEQEPDAIRHETWCQQEGAREKQAKSVKDLAQRQLALIKLVPDLDKSFQALAF